MQWRDGKRLARLLSVVYPLVPLVGVALHALTGKPAMLAAPLVIGYGLMPLLDALIGEDRNNPPEAVVPQLEADTYYRWLTWLSVPLYFLTLLVCAWWAGTQALPWWAFVILAYAAGANSGMGLTTGHELGHKHNAFEQWLARLILAVPAYGHFTVEHGRGHHRWVSTPEDHASARRARASTASRCASCPAACGAPGRWSRNGSLRSASRPGTGATPCCSPTRSAPCCSSG